MSKRSRRDRRDARSHRAVASGDFAAIRSASQRSPQTAAAMLHKFLQALGTEPIPAEALELVAATSERLRCASKFDDALKLAGAARRDSEAVCLEEALAAFACGHDDVVRQVASTNPVVARALAPVLAVVNNTRVPNAPAGASASARALGAVCRAVLALQLGHVAKARTALSALRGEPTARFGVAELRAVADLVSSTRAPAKAVDSARRLMGTRFFLDRPRAQRSLACALAERAPEALLDGTASQLGFDKQALCEASVIAACALGSVDGAEAQVSRLVASVGAEAFPEAHRGAASLYEGFAFARSDPPRARRAFDKAIALGADLVEALRGRLMTTSAPFGAQRELDSDEAKIAVGAIDRLVHVLDSVPDGAPFRALLLTRAAQIHAEMDRGAYALDAVRRARAAADASGLDESSLAANLDKVEAVVLALSNSRQAAVILDRAITRDERDAELWELRIAVARKVDGAQGAEELILRAGELGVSEDLVHRAMQVRRTRGLPTIVAGKTTAGQLALEFADRLRRSDDGNADPAALLGQSDLAECRSALAPDARVAFDAACVVETWKDSADDAIRLSMVLLQDRAGGVNLDPVLAACVVYLESDDRRAWGDAMVRAKIHPDLIARAARMVAEEYPGPDANAFLARVSANLTARQIKEAQAPSRRDDRQADPQAILRRADRLLAPLVSMFEALDSDKDFDLMEENEPIPMSLLESESFRIEAARGILQEMGLPPQVVDSRTRPQLLRIADSILAAHGKGASQCAAASLLEALKAAGIVPELLKTASRGNRRS